MSRIELLNQIEITTNANPLPNELKYLENTDYGYLNRRYNIKDFFIRDAFIEGKSMKVIVAIEDGKIKDSDLDYVALPCPPHCDHKDDGRGKITTPQGRAENPPVTFVIPQIDPTGYEAEHIEELKNQIGARAVLEIDILCNNENKKAIIGINESGRVMDQNYHKVAIKTS